MSAYITKDWPGTYDERHGGPLDRGRADSYYGRHHDPHFYVEDTYSSPKVEEKAMTVEEVEAYNAGYEGTEFNSKYSA